MATMFCIYKNEYTRYMQTSFLSMWFIFTFGIFPIQVHIPRLVNNIEKEKVTVKKPCPGPKRCSDVTCNRLGAWVLVLDVCVLFGRATQVRGVDDPWCWVQVPNLEIMGKEWFNIRVVQLSFVIWFFLGTHITSRQLKKELGKLKANNKDKPEKPQRKRKEAPEKTDDQNGDDAEAEELPKKGGKAKAKAKGKAKSKSKGRSAWNAAVWLWCMRDYLRTNCSAFETWWQGHKQNLEILESVRHVRPYDIGPCCALTGNDAHLFACVFQINAMGLSKHIMTSPVEFDGKKSFALHFCHAHIYGLMPSHG